jgi:hypothetical protein
MMVKETFFSKFRNSRTQRIVSAFLVINLVVEIVSPTMAMALTAGPAQPEFSSFEPVATTDMVNDFTGDFTYNLPVLNVPGPDGGGYSMSLSYHSGVSSEEEASWVGFGWTLNPGAVNRNKQGFPDEFNGNTVKNYNKQKPNWTQSAKFDFGIEINSGDGEPKDGEKNGKLLKAVGKALKGMQFTSTEKSNPDDPADISLSLSHSIRYNNYTGFSIANSFGVSVMGMANLSMNRSGAQNTYGFSVNPQNVARAFGAKGKKKSKEKEKSGSEKKWKQGLKTVGRSLLKHTLGRRINDPSAGRGLLQSSYTIQSFNAPALNYSVAKHSGCSWNFSGSVTLNLGVPLGFQMGFAGNMNVQAFEGEMEQQAYGYLYSEKSNNNNGSEKDKVLYDYRVEKATTFDKHDKYLGIPFNNADLFSATGSKVMGGFRFYHESIGTYFPNTSESTVKIRQVGGELGIGMPFQIGIDVGIGKQKTSVKDYWPETITSNKPEYSSPSDAKLRFTNDPGGQISYQNGNYSGVIGATVTKKKELTLDTTFKLKMKKDRAQSSSDVRYIQDVSTKLITGIEITDKGGSKNSYLQPVFVRNEINLTVPIESNHYGSYLVEKTVHVNDPMKNNNVVGQVVSDPYASTYLLTQNTTFNYVDADTVQGPSDGDFGGWTKFDYKKLYGGDTSWYRYRFPYNGLYYDEGRMCDLKDQTGSFTSGEKEVFYLKCIETKSHIAFFVTNNTLSNEFHKNFPKNKYPFLYDSTGSPVSTVVSQIDGSGNLRYDGLDAAPINTQGEDDAASSLTNKGTHSLEKLERIVLFAKSDFSLPLTTTHFKYDYSLCQGIPNSASNAPSGQRGKLTLTKVWTESNGVLRSQIAPYQFHYEYFTGYSPAIAAKYPWTQDYKNLFNQNPNYAPEQLDAWGFYQENGAERFKNQKTWVNQVPSVAFEPAAWQLKRIQLPSGGEIHIQYEQEDYSYVQDKTPMVMVSLLEDGLKNGYYSKEKNSGANPEGSVYCINVADIGVTDITGYANILENYFITKNKVLYFKALYSFTQNDPKINSGNTRSEYITGYTSVNEVSVDAGRIYLHLGDLKGPKDKGKKDKTLPRWVCYQELLTNGGQNLGLGARSYVNDDLTNDIYKTGSSLNESDIRKAARDKVVENTKEIFQDWMGSRVKNVKKKDACKSLNLEHSYFKLPVVKSKKGGGIRVQRLLSYDPGISSEGGDAMIYGSEYVYEDTDGKSSGVAVNEPTGMREENALVEYLERSEQHGLDKLLNGRDTKIFEGPLGESILPSAEVDYSRIVIKNIHSGKSTTGFAVNEYNTAKISAYSFKKNNTDLSKSGLFKSNPTYRKFNLSLPLTFFNLDIHRAWVTQGYVFTLNDMHGKIKSTAVYPGNYHVNTFSESKFSSKTEYNYSSPGEGINTLVYDEANGKIEQAKLSQGTEEDFTVFSANVLERTNDFSIELDLNIYYPAVAVVPGYKFSYSFSENLLCQHVTTRVVRQSTYLMSVTNIMNGVTQTTENLAFNKYTGDPVLTRTFDGYATKSRTVFSEKDLQEKHKGYYYSMSIPAAWMYPSMRPISLGANNSNQLNEVAGSIITYGENAMYDQLSSTDEWNVKSDTLRNVVAASVVEYKNNWFTQAMASDDPALANVSSQNLAAINKFFYPVRTYAYRDDVGDANATGGKIYAAGVINTPFKFFDWDLQNSIPSQWFSSSKITRYSPYGYPLEEEDTLKIKSAVRYGYKNILPITVAQNAAYSEIRFVDFEHDNAANPALTSKAAHSGRYSHNFSANPNYLFAHNFELNSDILSKKGLAIKLWLKSNIQQNPLMANYGLKNSNTILKAEFVGSQSTQFDLKPIAQTGEWTLYSAEIKNFNGIPAGTYSVKLLYPTKLTNEEVLVDDFRLQPLNASMNCSVYNTNNSVAVQFDDQHFGVFYEYDTKGHLVRKSIETERGMKTLQEQQYNSANLYYRN